MSGWLNKYTMIKKAVPGIFLVLLFMQNSCMKSEDTIPAELVINELMPVNSTVIADQNGEYDDWIELFNLSSLSVDISEYYLSDNKGNIRKWKFPEGTIIPGNGYLIIWADKDTTQTGLHSNFKLSSLGEELVFSDPDGSLIDEIDFPAQTLELSYSRYPNGTGAFRWQNPTYNKTNSDSK